MNKKFVSGVVTTVIGLLLLVATLIVAFVVVPGIIERVIVKQVALFNETEQMERFEELPFPMVFKIRFFNVTNPDAVLAGGVPRLEEVGPYVYKLYVGKVIEEYTEDTIIFRKREFFEFDDDASFPRSESDRVTIANVPYLALLQTAEEVTSSPAMIVLRAYLREIFGEVNSPIATFVVKDILFNGVKLCENPSYVGQVVCSQVVSIASASRNMEALPDGSLLFSFLRYRRGISQQTFEVNRGFQDPLRLGFVERYDGERTLSVWPAEPSGVATNTGTCNMINGTDATMFPPFLSKEPVYVLNSDVCRSVKLTYRSTRRYEGIDTHTYVTEPNMWQDSACFCVNRTQGITDSDGCLLPGALEVQPCVGGPLVVSYPHFLHAHSSYRNGVIGLVPVEENHQIYLEVEPYTGSPIQAAKRAQFNIFMRPAGGVNALRNVRTTLLPVFWAEESITLPDEFLDQIRNDLVASLNLLGILMPFLMSLGGVLIVAGMVVAMIWTIKKPSQKTKPVLPRPNQPSVATISTEA